MAKAYLLMIKGEHQAIECKTLADAKAIAERDAGIRNEARPSFVFNQKSGTYVAGRYAIAQEA